MREIVRFLFILIVLGGMMTMAPGQGVAREGATASAKEGIPALDLTKDAPVSTLEPKVTRLKNGLTVLVQEDERFPLASLRLYVHAGAAYEQAKHAGVSHLLEHMVFKGTAKRQPGQVARDIESVGGYLNAATSFDYTVYYVDVPSQHWGLGLDVIQDMIFGAAVNPEELNQERSVVLSELKRGEDDPSQLLFKTMQRLVWKDSPYGRPVIGYPETLEGIGRQDVIDYVRDLYQPQSMLLVVVGKVEADKVLAEAERLFGGLANDRAVVPPQMFEPPMSGPGPVVEARKGPWNKVYLTAAFPIPGFVSDKAVSLEVLGQLLGGDKTARLYRKFHYEERLVDDISVSSMTLERSGLFYIFATLDEDKLQAFWPALMAELKGLSADSFTDEEITRAKLNLEDSLFQAKETLSGLASKLGHFQFFEGSTYAENNYVYGLAHVDKAQLQDLIDTYLAPDMFYATMLLPEKSEATDQGLREVVAKSWPAKERKFLEAQKSEESGKMERVDLGGGRELVLLPDTTLPYTSVSLIWAGGDALLTPEQQGASELTARALSLGTKKLSATQLQDFLADRASHVAASSGRETFSLNAKFPSRFSGDILSLFTDIVFEPAFKPEDVERAKQDLIASIRGREDEPLGLAFMHIFPFLFQGSSYGYFHLGKPETVAAYTPDTVAGYWKRQLVQPWTMAVCGMYDRSSVVDMAKKLAARTTPEAFSFIEPTWGKERTTSLKLAERNQTHLLLIFPTPGQDHPDSAGLALLRSILAGQGGILFRELRDKQALGYSVTSFLWQTPKSGFMAFYIGTYPDKAEQAMAGFQKVLQDVAATPLSTDELNRAKNLLQGDYFREHQSLSSRSQEVASLLIKKLPADYNRAQIDQAQKLGPQDILALAKRYLNWDAKYIMRVEP